MPGLLEDEDEDEMGGEWVVLGLEEGRWFGWLMMMLGGGAEEVGGAIGIIGMTGATGAMCMTGAMGMTGMTGATGAGW